MTHENRVYTTMLGALNAAYAYDGTSRTMFTIEEVPAAQVATEEETETMRVLQADAIANFEVAAAYAYMLGGGEYRIFAITDRSIPGFTSWAGNIYAFTRPGQRPAFIYGFAA